jgi:DNA-binding response OmpR family regulator
VWTTRGQRACWPIPDDGAALVVADVHIDRPRRAVTIGDRRVRLRRRQFDLLVALVEADGRALTRADLLRAIGSAARNPRTRTIDMQISQLRAALAPSQVVIATVRGIGYQLAVREQAAGGRGEVMTDCKQKFPAILRRDHFEITDAPYGSG